MTTQRQQKKVVHNEPPKLEFFKFSANGNTAIVVGSNKEKRDI